MYSVHDDYDDNCNWLWAFGTRFSFSPDNLFMALLPFHPYHQICSEEVSLEEQTNNEKRTDYKQNKGKYSSKPLSPIFSWNVTTSVCFCYNATLLTCVWCSYMKCIGNLCCLWVFWVCVNWVFVRCYFWTHFRKFAGYGMYMSCMYTFLELEQRMKWRRGEKITSNQSNQVVGRESEKWEYSVSLAKSLAHGFLSQRTDPLREVINLLYTGLV